MRTLATVVVIVTATVVLVFAVMMTLNWQSEEKQNRKRETDEYSFQQEESRISRASVKKLPDDTEKDLQHHRLNVESRETLQTKRRLFEKKQQNRESFKRKNISPLSYVDLDGTWIVTNQNGSISVSGVVPGNVHTALQSAGLIGDPYYRFNDDEYRWITHDSWSYTRSFTLDSVSLGKKAARLVCLGLDTVSNVTVNGIMVGKSDNQFVGYVFDVTEFLQEGENVIEVDFQSAVDYAQKAFDAHPYLVPPTCPPAEYHPECHANFIRKAQCSFSWDWGPAFPTQGIWGNIGLELFDTVAIRSINPQPLRDENGWSLNVTIQFDAVLTPIISGKLILSIDELSIETETQVEVTETENKINILFSVGDAEPWWPRGYGEAKLYDLNVTFVPDDETEATSTTVRTGFRTIELVQDSLTTGLTFYFKINDVTVYMKGSNWIPMDSFLDRVTYDKLYNLLLSAVETNMNSIRIWGGGIYESDDFYDIADELGILVWQDMMFACSMYPVHDSFLKSVEQETRYQVTRLGRHPSLMAWTANNENEGALVDNWYGTAGANYPLYKSDYVTLYIDVVMATILDEDHSRPFLSSSPSNGIVTEENGWISESPRPGLPEYGDVHYYNYIDDCLDYTIYPHTRYSSEYGYQSWPSYYTLARVSDPDTDLVYGSQFFYHREHHSEALNGTEQIIRRHFTWPDTGDIYKDFKSYIYLTQVAQALCYQTQTEFYRRSRSDPTIWTMGALYWQHNDIWQAPSWSTIDYDGQWKVGHYFAARFFADPILSIVDDRNGTIVIYTVTDQLSIQQNVQLVVQMWTWNYFEPLRQWNSTVDVQPEGSQKVFESSRTDLISDGFCSAEAACFLTAFLVNNDDEQLQLTSTTVFYFVSWKDVVGLLNPNVKIADVVMVNSRVFEVHVTSVAISAFTWMEAVGISGHFSDNGFLMTSPDLHVTFYAWEDGVDEDALQSSIVITNLFNIYN